MTAEMTQQPHGGTPVLFDRSDRAATTLRTGVILGVDAAISHATLCISALSGFFDQAFHWRFRSAVPNDLSALHMWPQAWHSWYADAK